MRGEREPNPRPEYEELPLTEHDSTGGEDDLLGALRLEPIGVQEVDPKTGAWWGGRLAVRREREPDADEGAE